MLFRSLNRYASFPSRRIARYISMPWYHGTASSASLCSSISGVRIRSAWNSGEFEGEGALRIPVWPARFTVMLGSLLVTVIYVGQAANAAVAIIRGTAPDLPRPAESAGPL